MLQELLSGHLPPTLADGNVAHVLHVTLRRELSTYGQFSGFLLNSSDRRATSHYTIAQYPGVGEQSVLEVFSQTSKLNPVSSLRIHCI